MVVKVAALASIYVWLDRMASLTTSIMLLCRNGRYHSESTSEPKLVCMPGFIMNTDTVIMLILLIKSAMSGVSLSAPEIAVYANNTYLHQQVTYVDDDLVH